ncbi:S-adenosyl-L-methionine-dependent methyltransferase [Rhodofomes roseus]|uniref:S-adenosyl-L-methionine-dependent methyltransferase n=1 Tax=Rhodofomes roseus TaxID=34475 RepID=A0A4Y9YY17_9APHY|nr:S-adenosyl-L-methionine-dependent methyltransferase [Rhodofomes roseus]KAH9840641.1 S-adenosyl-L-methionine-dependent methyltransferase [Rhodofomes roseus]TFY67496.1 hypothetical protein EVJ58_g1584 [Rhodofomes roseus]
MKLSAALAVLSELKLCLQLGFVPTLRAILRSPTLLLRPRAISRIFMMHVWSAYGDGVDANSRSVKEGLIPANAQGVVLDVGAGYGHTVNYLDNKVTKYVALEPNQLMHVEIRQRASAAGFTEAEGTLVILPYGAEDVASIISALGGPNSVDTIISILSFCSVPDPKKNIRTLVDLVLRPGGQLLFYEHVLSPRSDVGWWQHFWTPVWKYAMDGCCLDRPTHEWIKQMDVWSKGELWGLPDESEEHIWWHRVGKFVKAGQ